MAWTNTANIKGPPAINWRGNWVATGSWVNRAPNPSMESDAPGALTIYHTDEHVLDYDTSIVGVGSRSVTTRTAVDYGYNVSEVLHTPVPVTPGETIALSVWVRTDSAGCEGWIGYFYLDANKTDVSGYDTTQDAAVPLAVNQWAEVKAENVVVPSRADVAYIHILSEVYTGGGRTALLGERGWHDILMVSEGPAARRYADGDGWHRNTQGGFTYSPSSAAWNGTPHASSTTFTEATPYAVNDGVHYNGSTYRVKVAHTAGVTTPGPPDVATAFYDVFAAKGEAGPAGPVGQFTYRQDTPAATWIVAHNLGRPSYPMIVLDGSPAAVYTDFEVVDANTLTFTFPEPVSGYAYL